MQALGDASRVLNDFKISFLEDTVQEMALEEHTQYCIDLIEQRFAQFNEYLLRKYGLISDCFDLCLDLHSSRESCLGCGAIVDTRCAIFER